MTRRIIPFTFRQWSLEACKAGLINMGATIRPRSTVDESTPNALFICHYNGEKYAPTTLAQAQELAYDVEQLYYHQ